MRRTITACAGFGLLVCLAVLMTGAGRSADDKPEVKARNHEIRMVAGNKFDQKEIEVWAGDTVTWINASGNQHSATADDGSELKFTEVVLAGGKFSDRVKFEKAGVVKYHCKFHAGMTGTITVKAAK